MQTSFSVHTPFAIFVLSITVHAAPVLNNTMHIDKIVVTTLQVRDDIQTIVANGGFKFQTCLPFTDNHTCTVAFLQNSKWQNANLYLYDQTCKGQLLNGKNAQVVTRQQLATEMPSDQGAPLPSILEKPVYVWVDAEWDGTDNHKTPAFRGVQLTYNGVATPLLWTNLHGLAAWTGFPTQGDGNWMFWRGSFAC